MAPSIQGHTTFDPRRDISSLSGKVIFVTGGTTGLGAETVQHLAAHNPSHIYFSGRNTKSGQDLIQTISTKWQDIGLTFVKMDLSSLASVKSCIKKEFKHDRLDILVNNAGIMAQPPTASHDGYEIQFATNHLGHAMLTKQLLPILLKTAALPDSDVRVITLTSLGFRYHAKEGIEFDKLDNSQSTSETGGPWRRYAQSKLANILYATELSRRHPSITSVSIHPGVVRTPLVSTQTWYNRLLIHVSQYANGGLMEPHQGAWNTVWAAAAAKKTDLRNGGMYIPVGFDGWEKILDDTAKDEKLAKRLWDWTEGVLSNH